MCRRTSGQRGTKSSSTGASTARVKVGISPMRKFAGDFAGERARLLGGVLERADRLDAALVVAQARRRRGHAGRRALEQLDPERALDRRHMLGNAGLGGVFPLGGAGEGAFLADRDDGADLPQRDIRHNHPRIPTLENLMSGAQNILFRLSAANRLRISTNR